MLHPPRGEGMRAEDFRAPAAGRLMTIMDGALAFIPAPLPPAIEYDAELVLALSRADGKLSELSGLGRQLPDPHLLIAPYLRQEAVLSSRIEGTVTTLSELLIDQAGGAASWRR
jgi:Fic family protein